MLNVKKGLALVLAAATAFTFAPVNAFAAATASKTVKDATTDDYKFTSHIDSVNFDSFGLSTSSNVAEYDTSAKKTKDLTTAAVEGKDGKTVLLKEHEDLSKVTNDVGTPVASYKIEISKPLVKDTTDTYKDLVVAVKDDDAETIQDEPDAEWNRSDSNKTATYTVDNTAGAQNSSTATDWDVNGAYVKFATVNPGATLSTYSVTVKVTAMDAAKGLGNALDSSTFTINVAQNSLALSLETSKVTASEGDKVTVAYHLENNGNNAAGTNVNRFYATADPKDLVSISADAFSKAPVANGNTNGVFTVTALKAGEVTVTIHADKNASGDSHDDATTASFVINITAGNGKLSVSYTTADGYRNTYTDNAEQKSNISSGIHNTKSRTETVENGKFAISSHIVKVDGTDKLQSTDSTKPYIDKDLKATATEADGVTSESAITPANSGTDKLSYAIDQTTGFLAVAKPLINGSNQTLQITASSDTDATVTYSLVAEAYKVDNAVGQVAPGTDNVSATYYYNPLTHGYSQTLDNYSVNRFANANASKPGTVQVATNCGYGDQVVYTEAAAAKYGSVDNTGLVTLKNSSIDQTLYVVVSATPKNATATSGARKTSTFVIPIEYSDQKALKAYVSSENGFADIEEEGIGNISATAANKIYLSPDHMKDTLVFDSNVSDAYVTGYVDDKDEKFTYSNGVLSATSNAKNGDKCKLHITYNSAPDVSGYGDFVFNVEFTDKKSTNTLKLSDAAVSKTNPRDKVESTTGVVGSTVVFDTDHYYKKDTNKRGYSLVYPQDDQSGAIDVTSTGWVNYNKNDGEVYVRAYAKADGYNPTGYVYAKVTYGQHATPNDLTVQEDRVVVKPGEKVSVHATASNAITFSIDDTSVATVASAGAIEVTGVKNGNTTLKVTAAANEKTGTPEKTISIPVFVSDGNAAEVEKPAKVTGLKVKNKKGAKVSVTWKAQDKTVLYRVYKKVGSGKWKAKNVTGAKATLDVKKGAKVQVKVKAFRRDENGKAVWQAGNATKAKTFKTDKK